MSHIPRFAAYAAAFEKAAASDDWSILEPFFAEDAVYDAGTTLFGPEVAEGRAAVFEFFARAFEGFDRRFESRELALVEGPTEEDQTVWVRGIATYRAPEIPEFVLRLEERITFDGDGDDARIVRLEDRYSEEMLEEMETFAKTWGPKLGIDF